MNSRIKDEKLSSFYLRHQNLALFYVPLDFHSVKSRKARCRLLVTYSFGQYYCLVFGKISTPKVCDPCPNPAHQVIQ